MMKRILTNEKQIVFTISLFAVILGCSKESLDNTSRKVNVNADHLVSRADLTYYLSIRDTALSKMGAPVRVEPIVDKDSDTLLYLVNYQNGWEILSSDKRTPQVVAECENGNINLTEKNPAFFTWLNMAAVDLKRIRHLSDADLSFSPEEIAYHINEWRAAEKRMINREILPGHWVLNDTSYFNETLLTVPHILTTYWNQSSPYNYYCPLNQAGQHYYVGCAGVAAGMMLYYLYKQNDSPSVFSGISMGSLYEPYSPYLSDVDSVAFYLRAINDAMGLTSLNYWDGGTFALPSQVVSLFTGQGYSCSYSSFDANTISAQLFQNKPSIILAFDEWILNIPNVTEGHYFIIDGYKKERGVTMYHYIYVTNDPFQSMPDRYEFRYTSPFINQVKMNWGWGDQSGQAYDGWYHITGNWVANGNAFNTDRHMISGFALL